MGRIIWIIINIEDWILFYFSLEWSYIELNIQFIEVYWSYIKLNENYILLNHIIIISENTSHMNHVNTEKCQVDSLSNWNLGKTFYFSLWRFSFTYS